MRHSLSAVVLWSGILVGIRGCSDPGSARNIDTALVDLALRSVAPEAILPGSVLVVEGDAFVDDPWGKSRLRLEGKIDGQNGTERIDVRFPARFIDFQHLEVDIDDYAFAALGGVDAQFDGLAIVEVQSAVDGRLYRSSAVELDLDIRTALDPNLLLEQPDGLVFPNEPIELVGDGLLLPGEGESLAIIDGCFTPRGATSCTPISPQALPVEPTRALTRSGGTFAFAPRIAGIEPGRFQGSIVLRNHHTLSGVRETAAQPCSFDLEAPILYGADATSASLGQYVSITGAGFVGAGEGTTELHFTGEFVPDEGGIPMAMDEILLPEFVDGRMVRYVINEDDALGRQLQVRYDTGVFQGMITPVIYYGEQRIEGDAAPIGFALRPVKQLVYVQFLPAYKESLRHYGLRAVDREIRRRVLAVIERDFATINLEVRVAPPEDFALYAQVDIGGPDLNGLGLLGYDNTPGKDTENQRLYDRIGGVNALTQEDGYPGYGGVFIESMFGYSANPGAFSQPLSPDERFDAMFDPFRPDRGGQPILSEDVALDVPTLEEGSGCPASEDDREQQVACAVFVMGNLIGTTVSHEIGHSLGLADPYGSAFHNTGDERNRLMDPDRPFAERTQLDGQGPSRFCQEEYTYLRAVLPTDEPESPVIRPPCN